MAWKFWSLWQHETNVHVHVVVCTFLRCCPPKAILLASSIVSHTSALPQANSSARYTKCTRRSTLHNTYHAYQGGFPQSLRLKLMYVIVLEMQHKICIHLTLMLGGSKRMMSNTSLALPPRSLHVRSIRTHYVLFLLSMAGDKNNL